MTRIFSARHAAALAGAFLLTGGAVHAQKSYDPGVTDTEITIGQTNPYSGPLSSYSTQGRVQSAYYNMINAQGGVNGRKIKFFSLDDGYQPPNDPLVDVARQLNAVRELKSRAPAGLVVIGSGYSYLQEYLPQVAQYALRHGWTDVVGLGRMTLSYPEMLADAVEKGVMTTKQICRTFSDCTTAPRNGLKSGCYPLDRHYATQPEARQLKEIKKSAPPS